MEGSNRRRARVIAQLACLHPPTHAPTRHQARTLIRCSRSRQSGQNIPESGWITAILIGAVAHGMTIATCLRTRYRRRRATRREAVNGHRIRHGSAAA